MYGQRIDNRRRRMLNSFTPGSGRDGRDAKLRVMAVFAVLFGLAGFWAIRASLADELPPATAGIVVQYKPGVDTDSLAKTYEDHAAVEESEITKLRADVVKVPPPLEDDLIKKLEQDPRVETVERDQVATIDATPNDQYYSKQWAWPKMSVDKLWDTSTGSESIIIAEIDSGVAAGHEDLKGRFITGYDFVNNDNDPTDDNGHGTAVAGILGATTNNGIGVAGACWKCKIMPLKGIGSDGTGVTSTLSKAITYAVDHGASLISMSISSEGESSVLKSAVDYAASKGVQMITSAGNTGVSTPRYPASYSSVISVANTDQNDVLSKSSTYGQTVAVAAPGQEFATTDWKTPNGYTYWSGTSFSTPATAGTYAVLKSAFPKATVAELREAITKNVDTCCDGKIAGGRVNATKALAYLQSKYPTGTTPTPTPPTPTPPTPTPPTPPPSTPPPSPGSGGKGDVNKDGKVNLTDLSVLLSNWGKAYTAADFNGNGKVDLPDLSVLLSNWGS